MNDSHGDYDYVVGVNRLISADMSNIGYYNEDMTDVDYFPNTEHITLVKTESVCKKNRDIPKVRDEGVSKLELSFTKRITDEDKSIFDIEDDEMAEDPRTCQQLIDDLKRQCTEEIKVETENSYREIPRIISSSEESNVDMDSESPLITFDPDHVEIVNEQNKSAHYKDKDYSHLNSEEKEEHNLDDYPHDAEIKHELNKFADNKDNDYSHLNSKLKKEYDPNGNDVEIAYEYMNEFADNKHKDYCYLYAEEKEEDNVGERSHDVETHVSKFADNKDKEYFCFNTNEKENNLIARPHDVELTNEQNEFEEYYDDGWQSPSDFLMKPNAGDDSSLDDIYNRRESDKFENAGDEKKVVNTTTEIIDDSDSDGNNNDMENFETDVKDAIDKLQEPEEDKKSPILGRKNRSVRLSSTRSTFDHLLIYPAPPAAGGLTINLMDYTCLEKGEYLNDVIIDFYLKYLFLEVLSDDDRKRTHIFSSHFYTRLAKPYKTNCADNELTLEELRYSGVQRWTKNINIFEKDFVILPINEYHHWYLAIICFPNLVGTVVGPDAEEYFMNNRECQKPCILIFDSLSSKEKGRVGTILRGYLHQEYLNKMNEEKPFSSNLIGMKYPKVPSQHNATDCGVYLLQYVEQFFKDPILDYTLRSYELKNWFEDFKIIEKRKNIADLIKELATKFKNAEVNLPTLKFPTPTKSNTHTKVSSFTKRSDSFLNDDNFTWEDEKDNALIHDSPTPMDSLDGFASKNQKDDFLISDSKEEKKPVSSKRATRSENESSCFNSSKPNTSRRNWKKKDGIESGQFNEFLDTPKLYGNNKKTYATMNKKESLLKTSYNKSQVTHSVNKNEPMDENTDDSFELEGNKRSIRRKPSSSGMDPYSRNAKLVKLGKEAHERKEYHNKSYGNHTQTFIRKSPDIKKKISSEPAKNIKSIDFPAAQDCDKFYNFKAFEKDKLKPGTTLPKFRKMNKLKETVD